jgi:hypothetical protein
LSTAETSNGYSFRTTFLDVVERERSQALKLEIRRNKLGVQPTAAAVQFFDPSGTSLGLAAIATPVTDGATYTILAASLPDTLPFGEGYRQEWTVTLTGDAAPRTIVREMAVARRQLYCVCAVEDLEEEYPALEAKLGGSVTLQPFVDAAWKRVLRELIKRGILTYTVVDQGAFLGATRELALYLALKDAYRKQGTGENRWLDLATTHHDNWRAEMATAGFPVDADQDGRADSASRESANQVVHPIVGNGQVRRLRSRRW